MNIGKLVKDVLDPLGVPVRFQTYKGNETTYITYFSYNEQGETWAENKEIDTGFYMQVDVWSKGDYTDLVEQVKAAMSDAGFDRIMAQDLYENDTQTYHKAIRFVYVDSIQ